MIGWTEKICWINGMCQGEFLLWDMSIPWDGPTEWS